MQSFGFGDQLVRVTDRDGGIWFVANDVCEVLEIKNPRSSLALLEEDERDGVHTVDAMGRSQQTTIISESGLYGLIFRSRKPVAVRFRKWVTGEVLPSIRRTGGFAMLAEPGDDPAAPAMDTMIDLEALRLKLQMVKMSLQLGGRAAGRRTWLLNGLPDVFEQGPDPALGAVLADAVADTIGDWMEMFVEPAPGHRAEVGVLYAHFAEWATAAGRPVASQTGFGRYLRAQGYAAVKSGNGRRQRVGLRLRP